MKLKIYMVQNERGQYYRRKQYYGGRWTDPQRASVWTSQGPADYVLKYNPKTKRIDLEIELP